MPWALGPALYRDICICMYMYVFIKFFSAMPGGEPTALCRGASRQRYAGGRADSVMPGGGPTALCRGARRQRYAGGGPTALCLPSVMPSQRTYRTYRTYHTYRLVLPMLNKYRKYLNKLDFDNICSKNVVFARTVTFFTTKQISRKRPRLVCITKPIVFKYQPI